MKVRVPSPFLDACAVAPVSARAADFAALGLDKTFPAFLAEELQEQQHAAENALFADAMRTASASASASASAATSAAAATSASAEFEALAEEHNALAIEAFGLH